MKVTIVMQDVLCEDLAEKKFNFLEDDYRDFIEWLILYSEVYHVHFSFKDQEDFPKDINSAEKLKDYLFYLKMYLKEDLDAHLNKYGCLSSFFTEYYKNRKT